MEGDGDVDLDQGPDPVDIVADIYRYDGASPPPAPGRQIQSPMFERLYLIAR